MTTIEHTTARPVADSEYLRYTKDLTAVIMAYVTGAATIVINRGIENATSAEHSDDGDVSGPIADAIDQHWIESDGAYEQDEE